MAFSTSPFECRSRASLRTAAFRQPAGRTRFAELVSSILILALFASTAYSDDSKGQYAVRGAALISCALFVQEYAAQGDVYLMSAAWVDGFITGANKYAPDTYDLVSFESTELLLSVVNQHCEKNPQDPVYGVLNSLFKTLHPDRMINKSEKTVVAVGEREAHHYQALISRVQEQLKARGFYDDPVNGAFSLQTIEAVKRFQESIDLNPTGFPDQVTLWRLLRREKDSEQAEQQ